MDRLMFLFWLSQNKESTKPDLHCSMTGTCTISASCSSLCSLWSLCSYAWSEQYSPSHLTLYSIDYRWINNTVNLALFAAIPVFFLALNTSWRNIFVSRGHFHFHLNESDNMNCSTLSFWKLTLSLHLHFLLSSMPFARPPFCWGVLMSYECCYPV